MPLPSFHKVRDNLVLEELMLGPGTPAPPPQAFYSNNTPAPPPLASSRFRGNGGQGQGQGRNRGCYRMNDGGNGSGGGSGSRNAPDQGNKG
jgi:hypothetical protein